MNMNKNKLYFYLALFIIIFIEAEILSYVLPTLDNHIHDLIVGLIAGITIMLLGKTHWAKDKVFKK
ncbi:MAG: hypothetical protein JWN90_112 [Parcubacteria group bacterium]|nr:hypothetical protein [Parcubacteria group bacterium]